MINMALAKLKGLDEYEIETIESIQEIIRSLLITAKLGNFKQSKYVCIENLEYSLQSLWGFDQNEKFHRHKHHYKWLCRWVGSKWKCLKTGEEVVIDEDIEYNDYIRIGEGAIDLGNICYHRVIGNVVEVKTKEN